ncbi:MAG: methionine synthase, partial [Planctomycetes bacterium]|nr:methionine synthase [Planctomycetota bacterium]
LTVEDYGGLETEGCPEWLLRTRPDIMPAIHSKYYAAGADVVETNSFGSMPHVLSEFGLEKHAYELSKEAAQIARAVANDYSTIDKPRFIAGSLGPGTKLISLGHIDWDSLYESYIVAASGLINGGVDVILIETCQDILQIKCAVHAARQAMKIEKREVPIQVQVTIEDFGTMLAGTEMATALHALESMPIDIVGINCATGPDLMDSHLKYLCEHSTRWVSCLPNAGLPRNQDGQVVYDLTPEELGQWHLKFVNDYGLNAAGGCCGTSPDHIAAVEKAIGGTEPGVKRRTESDTPSLSGLLGHTPLKQDTGILLVGERTNATGSKKFREMLFELHWDGMVDLAQEQALEGAHVLDVSVAWTGRDELSEMRTAIQRFATAVTIPLMIDTTQVDVLEEALKYASGRAIINSVNFEDGEEKFDTVCELAKRHGAALVALTIDEDKEASMAKTVDRKIEIADRIYERITQKHGIPGSAILFDLLTFPITQGDEDTRKLGEWTLDGIEAVHKKYPDVGFILGLSNISFGIKMAGRKVLNSVYLDEAIKRGVTSAILNAGKIIPINQIDEEDLKVARDLIYDRREYDESGECSYDPLFVFIDRFSNRSAKDDDITDKELDLNIEERLQQRIIRGKKVGIEPHLDQAMAEGYSPVDVINKILLEGMKIVGKLFGDGQMQLPFVLQSAECMKTCVRYLEAFMDKEDGSNKGCMVLATVKGDVHDIGKNLVDIILSNNGFQVENIGIKKPIEEILDAAEKYKPDAIGMSGLLVKSTVVMQENLAYMGKRDWTCPVILGGAALNRAYVEIDLRNTYQDGRRSHEESPVYYATDAFDGLQFMNEICKQVPESEYKLTTRKAKTKTVKTAYQILQEKIEVGKAYVESHVPAASHIPKPEFWGRKIVEGDELSLPTIFQYVNKLALYRGQWGFRQGQALSNEEHAELIAKEAEPVFKEWTQRAVAENMLEPKLVYGYYPVAADKNATIIYDPDNGKELFRMDFPRQMANKSKHLCISDFFRPRGADAIGDEESFIPKAAWDNGARDVIALHCVTMGDIASQHCQRLFKGDQYQDYLYFYGLSVESAEALAEYWHKRMRQQLGIAQDDALEMEKLFTQGYQGSRFSFGYPACPNLDDQVNLQKVLKWQDIGIELSEEFQLDPEQSTSGIVVHNKHAKYFSL